MKRIVQRALTATLAVVAASGCGQPASGGAGQAAPVAGDVAIHPTAPDSLPAAILGKAPPPQGHELSYFPGHPDTHGYLAVPEGASRHPALILIHEWYGLNDRVRQVADAMAAEGYVTLAADLYRGRTGSTPQEDGALAREALADSATLIQNLDAAAAYLRGRPDVTGKLATIGWCFGGGVALSYGVGGKHHDGTAMFYGRLLQDPAVLARMKHPLYGTFAGLDKGIPPDQVAKFVDALRKAGIKNDVHVYDDVNHGFWLWVDRDPAHNTGPALDAWRRLKAYLHSTIG